MVDFTNTYNPPGVYVDALDSPTIAAVGVDPTVLCLIGTGIGYHTYTEPISFASASTAPLTKKGINPNSVVVTGYVTDPGAPTQAIPHTFVKDETSTPHDYSLTVTGAGQTSTVSISKTSSGDIESAYPLVQVTYQYTDADYYALHVFEDYASFEAAYGPALDPATGAVTSPLSLAAQLAILNGANRLYAIAINGTGSLSAQFAAAYNLLSSSQNLANVIVPLWDTVTDGATLTGMLATLSASLLADEGRGVMRTAIVGFDQSYAPTTTDVANLAIGVSSPRVVTVWPNKLNLSATPTITTQVDGFYLAAAAGGLLAAQALQVPLTHKYPSGFSGVPADVQATLTKSARDQLSSSGVTVAELDRTGRLVIRHGVTTDYVGGGVLNREISIVRAKDGVYNLIQDNLDSAALIGSVITEDTALSVKGIVAGALETAKTTGLIVDYKDLQVREQIAPTGDPTVIEVRFSYQPSYPLNYVVVIFSIDTTTGDQALAIAA